jgi:hypothetical protein
VLDAPLARRRQPVTFRDYEHARDQLSEPLFDITDAIAGYHWTLPELRDHLLALSEAMRPEVETLRDLGRPATYAA